MFDKLHLLLGLPENLQWLEGVGIIVLYGTIIQIIANIISIPFAIWSGI